MLVAIILGAYSEASRKASIRERDKAQKRSEWLYEKQSRTFMESLMRRLIQLRGRNLAPAHIIRVLESTNMQESTESIDYREFKKYDFRFSICCMRSSRLKPDLTQSFNLLHSKNVVFDRAVDGDLATNTELMSIMVNYGEDLSDASNSVDRDEYTSLIRRLQQLENVLLRMKARTKRIN
jgi:hypothetical protein